MTPSPYLGASFVCVDDELVAVSLGEIEQATGKVSSTSTFDQLESLVQKGWELRKICGEVNNNSNSLQLTFSFNRTGELSQSDIQVSKIVYPISNKKVSPGPLNGNSGLGLFTLGYIEDADREGSVAKISTPVIADGGPNQVGFAQRLSFARDGETKHDVVLVQTSGGDYGIWQATLMFDPQTGKLSQLQYCNDVINPNTKTPGELSSDSFITKCQ